MDGRPGFGPRLRSEPGNRGWCHGQGIRSPIAGPGTVRRQTRRGAWADTNWAKLPEERQQAREEAREIDLAKNGPESIQPVDPNTAAKDELETLPGVGEAIANRIIAERENGRFEKPDDLLRVEGIGGKTLARFKDRLVFAPPHPVP
jgi:competence ComEA-like helix-hairpin-helix protein